MFRRIGLLVCALLLASCTANSPIGEASNGAGASIVANPTETAEPTPTATAQPTAEPTPRPTPEPKADVGKVGQWVYAWKSYEGSVYVAYEVILEVKNQGNGWAELSGFNSDYTILNASGGVTATGSFTYEYPQYLGPGETGYLVEDSVQDSVKVADFASVETSGRYGEATAPDITFSVEDIAWRTDQFSGGLTATGFVTATGGDADSVALAVLCIGDNGTPLGATTTNLIQNVSDGNRKGFETVTNTPPLSQSQCAQSIGYAESSF